MFAKVKRSSDVTVKELSLAEMFPLLEVLPDNRTLLTKEGALVQVIRLKGIDFSCLDQTKQEEIWGLVRRFLDDTPESVRIAIYHKRAIGNCRYKVAQYPSSLMQHVEHAYAKGFADSFHTEIFLVVSLATKIFSHGSVVPIVSKHFHQEIRFIDARRQELEDYTSVACRFLSAFGPEILLHKENNSPLLRFWGFLLNGTDTVAIPAQSAVLPHTLAVSDIEFSSEDRVIFREGKKERYAALLVLKMYPDETSRQIFEQVFSLPHSFVLMQLIAPQLRDASKTLMHKNYRMRDELPGNFAERSKEHFREVGNRLDANELRLYKHSFLLCVYAEDPDELEVAVKDIRASLFEQGVNIKREWSFNLPLVFWSLFPGYERYLETSRSVLLTSDHIADFNCWSGNPEGLGSCAFGPQPVTYFKTLQQTDFAFTFHASVEAGALGHTIVVGSAGSGKTTLVNFLLMACLKYSGLKILGFDSFNGCLIPFSAFGGTSCYVDIGNASSLRINPFLLPDTPGNRVFLLEWLTIAAEGVSEEEKMILVEAIDACYQLPREERCLSHIQGLFGRRGDSNAARRASLRERLLPYVWDEGQRADLQSRPYAPYFNGQEDTLSFASAFAGFDMGLTFRNPSLSGLFASYIFHAFSEYVSLQACPHVCFIDEMSNYLGSDTFGPFIVKAAREWRKRNGVLIGAVQEAQALLSLPYGRQIVENTASYILFPSANAREEDYREGFGLNEKEFSWIKSYSGKHCVMLKRRGGEAVVLDVNLSALGPYLSLFTSSLDKVQLAKRCMESEGEEWIAHYMRLASPFQGGISHA